MHETPFQALSADDRYNLLKTAGDSAHCPGQLLEKDIWVVETLRILFEAPFGGDLIFKGGTSLSKAWRAIRRFSEDVDITYDIRAFAPDLVGNAGEEALPPTRSQEKRWTKAIRGRLAVWVREQALPVVEEGLARDGFQARVRSDGERLYVDYDPLFGAERTVAPTVIAEFGARSTGEPRESRPVACDAAPVAPGVAFPTARPSVMRAERTFWEKATSMHVFCLRRKGRGDRLSRHWHDAVRLDDAGIARAALADRDLGFAVARHKAMFFVENAADGRRIDYAAAISGGLRLVPTGHALDALAADYARMLENGMLLGDEEAFDSIVQRCSILETAANRERGVR